MLLLYKNTITAILQKTIHNLKLLRFYKGKE